MHIPTVTVCVLILSQKTRELSGVLEDGGDGKCLCFPVNFLEEAKVLFPFVGSRIDCPFLPAAFVFLPHLAVGAVPLHTGAQSHQGIVEFPCRKVVLMGQNGAEKFNLEPHIPNSISTLTAQSLLGSQALQDEAVVLQDGVGDDGAALRDGAQQHVDSPCLLQKLLHCLRHVVQEETSGPPLVCSGAGWGDEVSEGDSEKYDSSRQP